MRLIRANGKTEAYTLSANEETVLRFIAEYDDDDEAIRYVLRRTPAGELFIAPAGSRDSNPDARETGIDELFEHLAERHENALAFIERQYPVEPILIPSLAEGKDFRDIFAEALTPSALQEAVTYVLRKGPAVGQLEPEAARRLAEECALLRFGTVAARVHVRDGKAVRLEMETSESIMLETPNKGAGPDARQKINAGGQKAYGNADDTAGQNDTPVCKKGGRT